MRPPQLPLAFAVFGAVWGAWQAALPDLASHYGLSSGPLGLILTAAFAVSLPAMLVTGRLTDRIGAGWAIGLCAAAMALGLLLVGLLPGMPLFVAAVVLFVTGSGSYDVAINGAAMGSGRWSGPASLTLLHAGFSGGGALGAVAAGLVLGAGTPFALVYPAAAVSLAAAVALVVRGRWPAPPGAQGRVPRAVVMALLPLAGLAGLAFLIEGSMESWSAIYLREVLGAAAFVGALGPASFHAAMFTGRLVGAAIAARLGRATTVLVAGSMIVAGMAVALLVSSPAPAVAGMAVAALGASFVVPVVVSLAAVRAGSHAGRAASYVLTLGYAGFLIGPSLIGILGEVAGLRVALAVVPAAAAVIAIASRSRHVAGADVPA
ncbi:MAG TPA: MFS transporter [Candidatus Limnocylindria bacterium]|nr:MFS transporter [Candidatus Limnocylindria bacterium]